MADETGPREGDDRTPPPAARGTAERLADHAAIERLANELLPALVARLAASGLGELEVREGTWRARLRQGVRTGGPTPADAASGAGRRPADRHGRGQAGHPGGHGPAAVESARASTNGSEPSLTPVGPGHAADAGHVEPIGSSVAGGRRLVATSPAVGVFHASRDVTNGTRVRGGDAVGTVDVLGVPAEVLAPDDAIVGALLVDPGDAVEYGQPLVELDRVVALGPSDGRVREG